MRIAKDQSGILVKDFLEYKEYIENNKDQIEKDTRNYDLFLNTIKIFYHVTKKELENFEYKTLRDMYKIIENILKQPQPLIRIFELDGVEYGLLPNLDDMTFGEMIDIDTDDVIQQIAVLYRPVIKKKGEKYSIEKYTANVEHMPRLREELTLDVYNGFISFFLNISQSLLNSTLSYMEKERVISPKTRKDLEENGLGFHGSMNYAGKT